MSAPSPGGATDRVRCAYCGANNSPTVPACWQCQRPLKSLRAGQPPAAAAGTRPAAPDWAGGPSAARPSFGADLSLAPKAAAALGLLFPWAGLPVGLAFLMLDDPRRVKLGWIAIGWSIAGAVLSAVALIPFLLALSPLIKSLLPHPGSLPGGDAPSGLPPLGGGEEFLLPHFLSSFIPG